MKGIDPIWEEIHSSRIWGVYPVEYIIRFVARNYYKLQRDKVRILDFGCGAGAHTWYLAREGFDTYAFDGSKSAVTNTAEMLKREKLEAHLSVQDGTALEYSDNFFDVVIDNVCIYANKLEDIHLMYENAFRVLKKGGRLLTASFGEELSGYKTGREIEPDTYVDIADGVLEGRGTSHIWKEEELRKTLEKAGFGKLSKDVIKYTDGDSFVHIYVFYAEKE